jgi:hypothetical protein
VNCEWICWFYVGWMDMAPHVSWVGRVLFRSTMASRPAARLDLFLFDHGNAARWDWPEGQVVSKLEFSWLPCNPGSTSLLSGFVAHSSLL